MGLRVRGWLRIAAPVAVAVLVAVAAPVGARGASRLRSSSTVLPGSTSAAPAPSLPTSTLRFDAIPRTQLRFPGDPTGAIGRNWFLTAANSLYALYDLSGTPVKGPTPLASLFARPFPSGTQWFEPRIVYDAYADAFVMAFLGKNGRLQRSWITIVAIPDATASDIGTWCPTTIDADRTAGDGAQFAEDPGLGFDADRVVITTNQDDFAGGAFRFAQILSFPKPALYDCSRNVRFATFTARDTQNPDGSPAFRIQPATTTGGSSPTVQYLLSFESGRPNFVVVWRLRKVGRRIVLTNAAIQVPLVRLGPYGTQGGGSLTRPDTWWDPGDLNFVNAFYDADRGRAYAANVVGKDLKPDTATGGYTESVVHWYEVRPAPKLAASTVTRSGFVGAPETDAGWGVVATDAAGNLFVTYSRASAVTGEFLSAWVAEIAPGSTRANELLLEPGTARFEYLEGVERWGSYAGIARDPVTGGSVAVVNQYAKADGGATTNLWQESVDIVSDAA